MKTNTLAAISTTSPTSPTSLTFNLLLSRFCFIKLKLWGQRSFTIIRMNNAMIAQKFVQNLSITHFIRETDTVTYSVAFPIKRLRVDIVHIYIIAGAYIIMALFTKGHVIVHHSPRTGDLSQISFYWERSLLVSVWICGSSIL